MTRRTYWEAASARNFRFSGFQRQLAAIAILFGWIAFGGIASTVMPTQWGLPIGGLLFGGLLLAAVPWAGGFAFITGVTSLTFATLAAIPAIDEATGLPGFVTFLLLVAFWIVLGIITARLIRTGRVRAAIGGRRRLAELRGGTYLPQSTVPIPGPVSAKLIKGVPTGATDAPAYAMVFGVMNGYQFTVSQRRPIAATNSEAGQTLWLLHLPLRLPFVSAEIVPALRDGTDPLSRAGDLTFARALLAPNGRLDTSLVNQLPPWWWIEGEYLCTTVELPGRRLIDSETIEETLRRLVIFAERVNWQALTTAQ